MWYIDGDHYQMLRMEKSQRIGFMDWNVLDQMFWLTGLNVLDRVGSYSV